MKLNEKIDYSIWDNDNNELIGGLLGGENMLPRLTQAVEEHFVGEITKLELAEDPDEFQEEYNVNVWIDEDGQEDLRVISLYRIFNY